MHKLAQQALENGTELPEQYHHYARLWFWLGIPAFLSIMIVIVLMVFKNSLFV